MDGGSDCTLLVISFNVEHCRKMLAKMIIVDELAFRFVEREGFHAFCDALQPKFFLFHFVLQWLKIALNYIQVRKKLKSVLPKMSRKICLTTNMWESLQNFNYMISTAHFIVDEWKLHKRILDFCQIPNHRGDKIRKIIENFFLE